MLPNIHSLLGCVINMQTFTIYLRVSCIMWVVQETLNTVDIIPKDFWLLLLSAGITFSTIYS